MPYNVTIMNETLQNTYLARHGETAWSLSGQHTGLTNLPLTARGKRNARRLGERLSGLSFVEILVSPLQRAMRTCELAGFGKVAEMDVDLVEWDCGYRGRTNRREADRQGQAGRSVCFGSWDTTERGEVPICKGGVCLLEIRQKNP